MTTHTITLPEMPLEDDDILEVICSRHDLQLTINRYLETSVTSKTDFGFVYGNGKLEFIRAEALEDRKRENQVKITFRVKALT